MPDTYAANVAPPLATGVDIPGTPADDTIAGDALELAPNPVDLLVNAGSGQGTVDGASGQTATGGSHTLVGLAGNDILAGDVIGDGSGPITAQVLAGAGGVTRFDFYTYYSAPDAGNGGSSNTAKGFNDSLLGNNGNDELTGDVFSSGDEETRLEVNAGGGGITGNTQNFGDPTAIGGDDNKATGFDDTVLGGAGDDLIVGDLRKVGGDALLQAFAGSGYQAPVISGGYSEPVERFGTVGDNNRTVAFNDLLSGTAGQDTLAGDVLREGRGTLNIAASAGKAASGPDGGGTGNMVDATNDTVFGGADTDLLVGDALLRQTIGDTSVLSADAGEGVESRFFLTIRDGGSANTVHVFNDRLAGEAGDDTVVGDVRGESDLSSLTLRAEAGGAGNGLFGGAGGDANTVQAFNDSLRSGSGSDTIVGDVSRTSSSSEVTLLVSASTGSYGGLGSRGDRYDGRAGGEANTVMSFNDTGLGGDGADTIVGDILQQLSRDTLALTIEAGTGAMALGPGGSYSAAGGDGGSDATIRSFADRLQGDGADDLIVGDISQVDSEGNVALNVRCGVGGDGSTNYYGTLRNGGDGGSDAHVTAFTDTLTGDNGNDWLIGDIHQSGSGGGSVLSVEVGTGGNDDDLPAGAGGSDNLVTVFDDKLLGGAGGDTLIGDLFADGSSSGFVDFDIRVGTEGDGGAAGGTGNVVSAFCDTLIGGAGDDLLVGDVYGTFFNNSSIEGSSTNTISAFRDSLLGGAGNDSLFGDGEDDIAFVPDLVSGDFNGRDLVFADTLRGGDGDDLLNGGEGTDRLFGGADNDVLIGGEDADQMSGGAGSDRFTWNESDLTLYDGSQSIPVVDNITDFSLDDVLDFTDFGSPYRPLTAEDITLRAENGDTIVSVSLQFFSGDVVALKNFTTTLSTEELVDDGVILIA